MMSTELLWCPITTSILLEGGRRPLKKTALKEDGSGDWSTTFWSNYLSSCQYLGQAFSYPKAFYIGFNYLYAMRESVYKSQELKSLL